MATARLPPTQKPRSIHMGNSDMATKSHAAGVVSLLSSNAVVGRWILHGAWRGVEFCSENTGTARQSCGMLIELNWRFKERAARASRASVRFAQIIDPSHPAT
jgi:hypothetical protein